MKKILGFFSSPIRILGGILVGLIILVFFLNRLGLIVKTTFSLGTSALTIEEVKDIGELMSAEFYGEIIHSLREGFETNSDEAFESSFNAFREKIPFFFQIHRKELFGNRQDLKVRERAKVWQEVYTYFEEYSEERERITYVHLLRIASKNPRLKKAKREEEINFFKELMNPNLDWATFIENGNRKTILANEKDKYASEILDRIDIHYLCRGWIKAGYNLKTIGNEEFKPDSNGIVQITGLDPYILAADINPWFIPPQGPYTNGVPGFELLQVSIKDKVQNPNLSMDEKKAKNQVPIKLISRTKKTARIELIEEALKKDIFETAKSSAEESIYGLMQMLDPKNKKGINGVEIVHSKDFDGLLAELKASPKLDFKMLDKFQHYIRLE
ncbi:MAG: hypothetical protein R8P61_28495 [Bacteroidia bacterium]|nr:hypothetical protein [Bacteroidia bacterium]